jgi:hypothetical protein
MVRDQTVSATCDVSTITAECVVLAGETISSNLLNRRKQPINQSMVNHQRAATKTQETETFQT